MATFAALPLFVSDMPRLLIDALFVSILILIIVIDLEHRLILTVVTFPTTIITVFLLSWFSFTEINFIQSISGAAVGFTVFYLLYLFGVWTFGEGALGFGDVMLSMTMGAMLGFPMIIPALLVGVLLGGVGSLILILGRTVGLSSYTPYGQYLAMGGIIMLIWGPQIVDWYFG